MPLLRVVPYIRPPNLPTRRIGGSSIDKTKPASDPFLLGLPRTHPLTLPILTVSLANTVKLKRIGKATS